MNFTKAKLAQSISDETGVSFEDAYKVIGAYGGKIAEAVKSGRDVQLRGFGTFKAKRRNAKMCRNIGKAQTMEAPARTELVFKASKAIRFW